MSTAPHDHGHSQGLDKETFFAWGKLVFGEFWNGEVDPPPDPKKIARLLRLGKPVPAFAQEWLADFLDPPRDGDDGTSLAVVRNRRAAQKWETKIKAFQRALKIQKLIDCGLPLSAAIDKIMPGQRRQGYAMWEAAQSLVKWTKDHPAEFAAIVKRYNGVTL